MTEGLFHPHDTTRSLPMALLRAREAVMANFRPMLHRHGITEQQWRVVRVLAEAEEMEVSQLAGRTSILAPSLSRILRTLEAQRIIAKRQDPGDGRVFWVRLSRQGAALLELVQPDSITIYRTIEAAVGKQNVDTLLDLLQDMTSALQSVDQGDAAPKRRQR